MLFNLTSPEDIRSPSRRPRQFAASGTCRPHTSRAGSSPCLDEVLPEASSRRVTHDASRRCEREKLTLGGFAVSRIVLTRISTDADAPQRRAGHASARVTSLKMTA
jgi:hypothetical protein